MISEIHLSKVRPHAFKGSEYDSRLESSHVWMSDLTFRKGCYYMVAAESGAGKSSLCSFLYGLRRDYDGSITIDGVEAGQMTIAQWCELRNGHLAYLPQEMHLFPELTVMENIRIKNRLTGYKSEDWIKDALSRLGVADKSDVVAGKLSVGQQQRVAIIRSLCQPFDFVLVDEPVSHLDERNNELVAAMISEEASKQGAGIIATSVGNDIKMEFNSIIEL